MKQEKKDKMRKYQTEHGMFFISKDRAREFDLARHTVKEECQLWENALYRRLNRVAPEILNYNGLYEQLTGLKRRAILNTHGQFDGRDWIYFDGDETKLMQEWISEREGEKKYSSLMILACCPAKRFRLQLGKSLLIMPDREIPYLKIEEGITLLDVYFELRSPEKGLIHPYTYEREIEELEEQLGKKTKRSKKIARGAGIK